MKFKIDLKVRRCTRCGHFECTHCRTFCDDSECIFGANGDPGFDTKDGGCLDFGQCVYDEPMDVEGYKRFDAKADELRQAYPNWCGRLGDQTTEDGEVFILFDERAP